MSEAGRDLCIGVLYKGKLRSIAADMGFSGRAGFLLVAVFFSNAKP